MATVLKLHANRRNRMKWSTFQTKHFVTVRVEWRTKDRAGCLHQSIHKADFQALRNPAWHFWQIIDFMTDCAKSHGGRC